jgi:hypothetical protein
MSAFRKLFADTRFEIFAAVEIHMAICWFMAPCGLVDGYQRLEGTFYLHLHGRRRYVRIPLEFTFQTVKYHDPETTLRIFGICIFM